MSLPLVSSDRHTAPHAARIQKPQWSETTPSSPKMATMNRKFLFMVHIEIQCSNRYRFRRCDVQLEVESHAGIADIGSILCLLFHQNDRDVWVRLAQIERTEDLRI